MGTIFVVAAWIVGKGRQGRFFVGKIFVVKHSTTKTTNSLPHENYPLYGNLLELLMQSDEEVSSKGVSVLSTNHNRSVPKPFKYHLSITQYSRAGEVRKLSGLRTTFHGAATTSLH